jgi:DNA primase
MATQQHTGIADVFERDVLPALTQNLDHAFPEFGWQRDAHGWRATNQAFTHATLGVRADRVVCHGDAPRGFLIHGQGPVLWTTYINDGHPARGRDFIDSVRKLADRAGIDADRLDRPPTTAERKASLLEDAIALCRRELASGRSVEARDYLKRRGIPPDRLEATGLGVMPDRDRLRLALISAGHTNADISASGLLADTRWPGRVVGAWRNEHNRFVTLWARTIRNDGIDRYLYLRGAPRGDTIPYGLSDTLASASREQRAQVLLVEGVLDVHILRAHGVESVAALGGTATSRNLFERLTDVGVERVVLALDNDDAGRTATAKSIDASVRASRSPDVWVVDPGLLDTAKDPAELISSRGADAWQRASAAPVCGVTWRALDLTGPIADVGNELSRRVGFARAAAWLGRLPDRLAIEQTNALDSVADSLGYDAAAARRRSERATGTAKASRRYHERRDSRAEPQSIAMGRFNLRLVNGL